MATDKEGILWSRYALSDDEDIEEYLWLTEKMIKSAARWEQEHDRLDWGSIKLSVNTEVFSGATFLTMTIEGEE